MMCSHFVSWRLLLALSCVLADELQLQNQLAETVKTSDGFGYELIQTKLDYLEYRFAELFSDLKEHHKHHEHKMENLVKRLEGELRTNMSLITDQSRKILKAVDPTERYRSGGDWLDILQRNDGSEDFNRNWADYRDGFGTVGQEFWLGLEQLHQLTKDTPYELRIEMEDFGGNHRYAQYNRFAVGSEAESYPLKELGSYRGTAGDSLTWHKGCKFSAKDKGQFRSCVDALNGGWWYKGWDDGRMCYISHLTGKWDSTHAWTSITWNSFGSPPNIALKYVRMSIRKI